MLFVMVFFWVIGTSLGEPETTTTIDHMFPRSTLHNLQGFDPFDQMLHGLLEGLDDEKIFFRRGRRFAVFFSSVRYVFLFKKRQPGLFIYIYMCDPIYIYIEMVVFTFIFKDV